MESTYKYVPGSNNRLQMIEDCDEKDKSIFQEISDSQKPKNNDINTRSIVEQNIQLNIQIWWTLLKYEIIQTKRYKQSFKIDTYPPKANNIQKKSNYNSNFFSPEIIELKKMILS